jgi:putative DNA primase/helicase
MNQIEQFRDVIRAAGLQPPDVIEPGKFHKFPGEGKRNGNTAAWCKLFADGIGGIFGDYSTGLSTGWQANRETPYTQAERETFMRDVAEAKAQAEKEKTERQAKAAEQAAAIWDDADDAPEDHPYLVRKGIKAHGLRVYHGDLVIGGMACEGALIAPMKIDGAILSLQFINAIGDRRFYPGGRTAGAYFAFGTPAEIDAKGLLCIAEGPATAATVYEATGIPTLAAFSAGFLVAVGTHLQKKRPIVRIIIAGDVDKSGTGQRAATEAANAVGGLVALPPFTLEELAADKPPSDWNDYSRLRGAAAVKQAIEKALQDAQTSAPMSPPSPTTASAPRADSEGWPAPMPLPKLPPVPDFALDLLPDALMPWIADAAERARFRPDFAAVASMAALGSVIGRRLGIRLKQQDDWTEYANIWGLFVGPPSSIKSTAHREGGRPFKALQVAADGRHADAMSEYEAQAEAFKLRRDAKRKAAVKALEKDAAASIDMGDDEAPEEPIARTYWTSDVNEASLGVLLARNPNGILVERDELSSQLVSLEDERNATLRGMLLSGWSGNEGYRFDRIGRGTTALSKFAISIVGGIQPGPLARYVRSAFSGERADGLLQRFQLAVWPDPEPFEYVDRWPNSKAREAATALFERADTFDAEAIGGHDGFGNPPFVRLSAAAQEVFRDWYLQFMQSSRGEESAVSEPLAAHFGKYPGLVGKLALIVHVADDPGAREVSERTLLKTLSWIDYLTPHARRIYHAVEHPETGAAELLLLRLRRRELPASFKAWELTRKGWHGLTDREGVKKACRLLFEYGWLIELDPGGGQGVGRPADPGNLNAPSR